MFKGYYEKKRFNYIDKEFQESNIFDISYKELIPKTACFFSNDLNVFIDTSDGVNEDLKIYEYCGRILSCIKLSKNKKFLFFKSAYSKKWTKNIEEIALKNNGEVIPFFKWSFNDQFYSYLKPNLEDFKKKLNIKNDNDIGFFANPNLVYNYPKSSKKYSKISCTDIRKFNLSEDFGEETGNIEFIKNNSRKDILNKLIKSKFKIYHGPLSYKDYIHKSIECKSIFNPPGIGEYTSRMFDQTAIGNLVILRKNSYDQGISWKKYIPEVDMNSAEYSKNIENILNNSKEWKEKGNYYYNKIWNSKNIFLYLKNKIEENL